MEIAVNNQNYTVPERCNINTLLNEVLNQAPKGIAVAINNTIVPRSQWETSYCKTGDKIILIKATQGG
jgi:sulfur carrier protein